jgi:cell division protease FtsH
LVGYPNVHERAAILERHAQTKPVGPEVDLFRLARRAIGFSGADLENLLNESAIAALRRGVDEIAWQDLDEGYNRVLVGPKKVDNPMTEDEKRMVAYHEAGHALITRLVANLPIDKVTIAPTNRALGYVLPVQQDSRIKTKRDLFNNVCIALGGMAAEKLMFGDEAMTTGNQQDIREATSLAYKMVSSLGMSKLGAVALNGGAEMADCLSDDIKNEAFAEMQTILRQAEEKSRAYLAEHQYLLERLAAELVEVETMDGEQLDELVAQTKRT